MGRNKGICTLCGKGGPLTFEHVPAEGGLNVRGVTMHTFQDWMQRDALDGPFPNGIPQPEGTGLLALCGVCNEFLGREYVPAFIRLVKAGQDVLSQLQLRLKELDGRLVSTIVSVGLEDVDRLACAKQIVSMILVTSGRDVVKAHPALAQFVLSPDAAGLPAEYRLFLAVAPGPIARTSGVFVLGRVDDPRQVVAAEAVYPPFAYLLVFNDGDLQWGGEITSWASAPFGDSTTVSLDLRVGFTHTAFPGDLRPRAKIEAERQRAEGTQDGVSREGLDQVSRIRSDEYEKARSDVRHAIAARLAEVDRLYDVVEGILTGGSLHLTKTRGLNEAVLTIVLLQLTKALKTCRAIRACAMEGCGQDAAVLLRSLFETCTAVLWLLQRDTKRRAKLFAAHADVRWQIMAQGQSKTRGLKRLGKRRLKEVQPVVDSWTQELGAPTMRAIRQHWSGLPGGLGEVASRIRTWSIPYNTVYRDTSSSAHGSDPAAHVLLAAGRQPRYKLLPGTDECDRVLAVTVVVLHTLAARMSIRMGLGFESALSSVKVAKIRRRETE